MYSTGFRALLPAVACLYGHVAAVVDVEAGLLRRESAGGRRVEGFETEHLTVVEPNMAKLKAQARDAIQECCSMPVPHSPASGNSSDGKHKFSCVPPALGFEAEVKATCEHLLGITEAAIMGIPAGIIRTCCHKLPEAYPDKDHGCLSSDQAGVAQHTIDIFCLALSNTLGDGGSDTSVVTTSTR